MEQNELIDIEDLPQSTENKAESKPVLKLEGEKDLVFVYGTLKAAESAAYKLKDSAFLGSVLSPVGWTLTGHNDAFPKAWPYGGRRVKGEVYIVSKNTLNLLDSYEGIRRSTLGSVFRSSLRMGPRSTLGFTTSRVRRTELMCRLTRTGISSGHGGLLNVWYVWNLLDSVR